MADVKITALTAISSNPVNPATFPIPMVDLLDNTITASGTTKKVTVNQILGAGGTATLASATITGAATVGTTLGVTGVSTFAAGTALLPALTTTGDTNTGIYYPAADTFAVTTAGVERYRVDSSGNVGIGVAPSAWGSGTKALEFANGSVISFAGYIGTIGTANSYYNGTNFIFKTAAPAARYDQDNGAHKWFRSTNVTPTAGGIITFDQAMTLDASGNLSLANGNVVMATSGKGIDFSAVTGGTGTATGNVLNDYEEGTFTPTPNSGTFSAATGRYTKIGNMVTIFFDITVGAGGGSQITNLPFVAAGASTVASGIYTNAQTYAAGTTAPVVVIGASGSIMYFRTVGTGVAFSAMTLTNAANLTGSISYFV